MAAMTEPGLRLAHHLYRKKLLLREQFFCENGPLAVFSF